MIQPASKRNNGMTSYRRNTHSRSAKRGFTLIELAVAMIILAVLGVAVSSVVRSKIETQMARRLDQNMQDLLFGLATDLRTDIRMATNTTPDNSSDNKLVLEEHDSSNALYTVTYEISGGSGNMTRTDSRTNSTRLYNDPAIYGKPSLTMTCVDSAGSKCFTVVNSGNTTNNLHYVHIGALTASAPSTANSGNIIDRAFNPGGGARKTIPAVTINVMSKMIFQ